MACLLIAAVLVARMATGAKASSTTADDDPVTFATPAQIDAFLHRQRADLKLAGLAVVVLSQGSVIFDRAYGDASPNGPAVTQHTPFVLGSTSKQFTGLAIQQLIAQGKLALNDSVGSLLRPFGAASSPFADVTVAQLLGHTSGISTRAGAADVFDPRPAFTSLRSETLHLLRSTPSSKPGVRFEYSNGNYTLLGSIIETVTGQTFEAALQTLVGKPLGLSETTSDLALAQTRGLAVGHYTWLGAIDSTTPGPRWPMGAPSAFTSSTASDLVRLLRAELGESSGIAPAVIAADHAPLATINSYSKYASGWYVRSFWELNNQDAHFDDPSLPLIYEHDGTTGREMSYVAFAPDLDFGVALLTNTGVGTDADRESALTDALLHKIVGTTARPRVVDRLTTAAPFLMVGLPLAQLAVLIAIAASIARPRRSRLGRWAPRLSAALVTLVTLLVVFLVVPGQTDEPLLDRAWWSGVPDLAVSVAVSLLLAVACVVLGSVGLIRAQRRSAS